MKKKLLSVFLTISIIFGNLSLISTTAGALETANNEQQIEYEGGWNPADYPVDGTLYKDRIAVSKTIAPTEDENYFDITLKVVAKPRVIDQSVDVVVVMDVSNTMNSTHDGISPGGTGYNANDARIVDAKNAVNTFVAKYATDANISMDRRFGLVTFNSYANTIIPLQTLNTAEQAQSVKTTVNAITAPKGNRERFTNIEGGLQLAYNLLKTSEAKYRYIIFLTDGFPTTYIESGADSTTQIVGYDTFVSGGYNYNRLNEDGYFADSVTGKVCSSGTDYSDKAADRADDVAAEIKSSGINIFSIGLDVGAQSVDEYVYTFRNSPISTVDRRGTTYVIGNTTESYRAWLGESIAGGKQLDQIEGHNYATGDSAEELQTAFTNILKDMELLPAETMEEAYTIDPMSDFVQFKSFYDNAGNEVEVLVNSKTSQDVATFDSETETIKWMLKNTEGSTRDEHGNYVLSIRYKVRLENEVEGFTPSSALKTNDKTTFYFRTVNEEGDALYGDNEIDYYIPEVEGYLGKLVFTKQDSVTGEPLEGAEFKLQHYGESCHICNGDAVIADETATSDVNGRVVFDNLPSGHEYVLIETKAPQGYQPGTYHSVNVAYGKTYLDGTEVTEENTGVIKNQTIKPVEVVLTAQKTLVGRTLKSNEFTFVLEGVGEGNVKFHEKAHNDGNGYVAFEKIIFDEIGTYNFKVYEEKGTDTTVRYDDTVYEVQFIVGVNDESTEYTLTTKIDGQDVENDSAPQAMQFTNTLRGDAYAVISAVKLMDGEAPQSGAFTFELRDETGKLVDTKKNGGSNVTFDSIAYSQTGTYKYTISEVHGEIDNIYYNHSVYNAVVTVTAPENSESFLAEVEYSINGTATEIPQFNNKTRKPAILKINALKTMDGVTPREGAFTFELRNSDGQLVETVTNDRSGTITFSPLSFNEVGYTYYTISEVNGGNGDIIYDKIIYYVYVITEAHHNNDTFLIDVSVLKPVADDYEFLKRVFGATEVEITTEDEVKFANTSREGVEVVLTAEKTLNGKAPTANDVFTFELAGENGFVYQTVNNDGSNITFRTIEFTKAGEYYFTISEVAGDDEAVIYDNTVYDVTVIITAPENSDEKYEAEVVIQKNGVVYTGVPTFENTKVEPTTEPPTTEPTEPTTEAPTDPVTEPTEPTTEAPTDPVTEPTEPTTEAPTDPVTEPTEPTTEAPTDPVTEPTEPTTEAPTDPVTEPTEPTTEAPTDPVTEPTTKVPTTTPTQPTTQAPNTPIKTGDTSNLYLWIALLFVSGGVFVKVTYMRRKEE